MNINEQVDEWVNGNPVHNDERDECCPDFSCCVPEVMASDQEREQFSEAYYNNDTKTQNEMLSNFLQRMVTHKTSKKVHIAGEDDITHDAGKDEEGDALQTPTEDNDESDTDNDHHEQMEGPDEEVP